MKKTLLVVCLLILLAVSVLARPPIGKGEATSLASSQDLQTFINANRLLMFVTNEGSFAYDQGAEFGKNDGLYYPYTSIADIDDKKNTTSVIFAAGVWVGGLNAATGDTIVTVAEYSDDYYNGPMVGGTFVPDADLLLQYKVYKLYADSMADNPNADYLNWPVADGAPVDSNGNPELIGDQMCWAVYNDANPAPHINDASTSSGMGVEIRQTTFAFAREGALANIVFVKFQVYNKGTIDVQDMFLSLWADPDLGDAGDDLVGCDVDLSLGYCYNAGSDADYGADPPAVGFDFFQGPLDSTGNVEDTARAWGQLWPGNVNLPMSSFNKYINGTDPQSPFHTYNLMNGLTREGEPLVDPVNGDTTKFYGNGDPVTGTGFIDVNQSDRRYKLSTGPFDFAIGDSTEIVAAIIVGRGTSHLKSITELKNLDLFAQKVYDSNFVLPSPPAKPDVFVKSYPDELLLTWGTKSEDDPGDYPFEGYAVIQGPTVIGPWTDTLGWFDIKNGIGGIIDFRFSAAAQAELPYVAKPGPDDGLRHLLFIDRDVIGGGGLVNYTDYFYRVEAYSYDPDAPNGDKTLTSATVVTATPRPPIIGTEYNAIYGDTLIVEHSAGNSPGSAGAMVVDPSKVTGDEYMIVFETVAGLGNVWHVINTTTTDTVVLNWSNQSDVSGANNYPVADGIMFFVSGAAPSIEIFQVVANGAGPIDPPVAGALDFAGFPTGFDAGGVALRPGDDQQVGLGHWALHTGDNGGSCDGGDRGSFDKFIERSLRGSNISAMGGYDYEMRFTGDTLAGVYDSSLGGGSIAIEAFNPENEENPTWVPFELWRTGIGTPNDLSDDVRMVPWHLDFGDDDTYNLESYGCASGATTGGGGEHSVSGGDNDPYTDWIYWVLPDDDSPGDAGYQSSAADILAWTPGATVYDFNGTEIFARTVLVNWNGDTTLAGDFDQLLPEPGTVFRIVTAKPNGPADQFTLSTAGYAVAVAESGSDADLVNIKTVPNPYYLHSNYDANSLNRAMRFINLPEVCKISIYNLMGDHITTIEKNDMLTEASWDVQNSAGIPVASGIYIYVVEAPGFGQKIGKMAIFTEIELLDQY